MGTFRRRDWHRTGSNQESSEVFLELTFSLEDAQVSQTVQYARTDDVIWTWRATFNTPTPPLLISSAGGFLMPTLCSKDDFGPGNLDFLKMYPFSMYISSSKTVLAITQLFINFPIYIAALCNAWYNYR